MNRILATIAVCLLLGWGARVPAALSVDTAAQAQEGQTEPATKTEPTTKTEPATKAESAAKTDGQAPSEPKTKSGQDQPAPVPGVIRALGVAAPGVQVGESEAPVVEHQSAAHGHGHDDPSDLSHGDGSSQLKAPLELRFDLAIATLIVFLLLAAILAKFAWGPIVAGLEKREQTIAKQIADAEHASAMAAKQLQEYERKLAAATEEARAIVGQARQDAISAKDKIVAEAQAAAAKERDKAVADITSAKNLALQEIAEKSVSTAISLASNIIRREVKAEDHDKLINESLQKLSSLN
jgi:F-type H+-transporting ATPase subunit b